MSNLVPEKRMDKNGVLTTKHVRAASDKDSFKGTVPAPKLFSSKSTRVKLNKGQTTPKPRKFFASRYGTDTRLKNLIPGHAGSVWREFDISDKDMYSVMGVTDRGTAVALMTAGYTSGEEALKFLSENGLDELIEDHSSFLDEALKRRIEPELYLEAMEFFPYLGETKQHMDALEAYSFGSIRQTSIYEDVYHGLTSLEAVKAVGVARIAKAGANHVVRSALKELSAGIVSYTAEDLGRLVERHPHHVFKLDMSTLIADRYGVEFALELDHPNHDICEYLEGESVERERLMNIVRYYDEVDTHQRDNSIYSELYPYEYMVKAYDAGLDVSSVAEGKYTLQQLDAISDGMEKSVSGGWL